MKKKVNNALYATTISIGASRPKQMIWYLVNIFFFKNSLNIFSGLKVSLLRMFGAKMGLGIVIKPSVNIKYPWKLEIGDYCWIGEDVWIDNLSNIVMGQSVTISQGALILTGSHDYTRESFDFLSKSIVLEEGTWIGACAIVVGGVVCKSHSVLGAGSIAIKDLQPYTIYHGNPAIAILTRNIT